MINFILEQMMTWWQFTVVGCLVVIGWLVNLCGVDNNKDRVGLKYTVMPSMTPLKIETAGKGFWSAIWMWFTGVRHWQITRDWIFELNGVEYCIPAGFKFDGASVPKFLATWLSPVGVLLVGGLVHDYAYKYTVLLHSNKKAVSKVMNQKEADIIFRDINIEQNGMILLNYLAYWALRIGGFVAWKGHRKVGAYVDL